jgi:hypothetical protein
VIDTVAERELVGYAILTYNYDLEFGGVQGIITDSSLPNLIGVTVSADE